MKKIILTILILSSLALSQNNKKAQTQGDQNETLWKSNLEIGVQLHPDYDENGTNSGLKKTRPYVNYNLDARWLKDMEEDNESDVINIGSDIRLLGTATSNGKVSKPNSYNDVTDTLDASVYYQYIPSKLRFGLKGKKCFEEINECFGSEIGIIARLGVQTREEKLDNDDTVSTYADAGLKYTFFRRFPYNEKGIAKDLADGYMGIYARHYFDDYNNFDSDTRIIVDMKYQVTDNNNFLIGCELNGGKGEDEIFLTLTYRNNLSKLLGFFSF